MIVTTLIQFTAIRNALNEGRLTLTLKQRAFWESVYDLEDEEVEEFGRRPRELIDQIHHQIKGQKAGSK